MDFTKFHFRKSCEFEFFYSIWQKILNLKSKNLEFSPKKICFFSMFWRFNFGSKWSKSRFLARKFNYFILFGMEYSSISSNFGTKIQMISKSKVLSKLNFWTKVRLLEWFRIIVVRIANTLLQYSYCEKLPLSISKQFLLMIWQ